MEEELRKSNSKETNSQVEEKEKELNKDNQSSSDDSSIDTDDDTDDSSSVAEESTNVNKPQEINKTELEVEVKSTDLAKPPKDQLKSKSRSRSRSKKRSDSRHHSSRHRSSHKHSRHHHHSSSSRRHRHKHRSRSHDRDRDRNRHHKHHSSSSSSKHRHRHSPSHRPHKSSSSSNNKADSNENFKRRMEEMLNTNGRKDELEMQRRVELAKDPSKIKMEETTGGVVSNSVKLPTFYNPNAVNPLVYAEQERKRKLLWSKAKDNETTSTTIVGKAIVQNTAVDEKRAQKFRKLMGIKDEAATVNASNEADDLNRMQETAFNALDKEYEFARRATHTHRGMGLGFLSYQQPPPS